MNFYDTVLLRSDLFFFTLSCLPGLFVSPPLSHSLCRPPRGHQKCRWFMGSDSYCTVIYVLPVPFSPPLLSPALPYFPRPRVSGAPARHLHGPVIQVQHFSLHFPLPLSANMR